MSLSAKAEVAGDALHRRRRCWGVLRGSSTSAASSFFLRPSQASSAASSHAFPYPYGYAREASLGEDSVPKFSHHAQVMGRL